MAKITINNVRGLVKALNKGPAYLKKDVVSYGITYDGKYYLKFSNDSGTTTTEMMSCKECYMYLQGILHGREENETMVKAQYEEINLYKVAVKDIKEHEANQDKEINILHTDMANQKVMLDDRLQYIRRLETEIQTAKEHAILHAKALHEAYFDETISKENHNHHSDYIDFLESLINKMRGYLPFNAMFMDYQGVDATLNLEIAKQHYTAAQAQLEQATKEILRLKKENDDHMKELLRG